MPLQPRPHTLRWLRQELPAWEREGLLSPESADALRTRYPATADRTHQLWPVLLAGFGACLIGAGVISLFAYNWDQLGRPARTVLAVLPLLLTQALAFLTLARWNHSAAMREGVCAGLILSIGAAIALVAQTYQIGGDFARFMLTWFVLALPATYLLRSGLGYWLCQIALIVWGSYASFRSGDLQQWYPLFFAATVPYYFWIRSRNDHSAQISLNKWALALSAPLGLILWLEDAPDSAWQFSLIAYFAAGLLLDQHRERLRERPFALMGAAGVAVLILALSLYNGWANDRMPAAGLRLVACIALGLLWLCALVHAIRLGRYWLLGLGLAPLPVLFTQWICATADSATHTAQLPSSILTLYTLAAGLVVLVSGIRKRQFALLNLGLALLGALAVFKFFDSDLGLAVKGAAFILIGCLFLAANLVTLRRFRKGNTHA